MTDSSGGQRLETRASGSSFYAAIRLLPRDERDALFAVYAFCRAVDDISDDGARPRPERQAALEQWRRSVEALYAGKPAGEAAFLAPAITRYDLRKTDFLAIIDGVEMDVKEDITAPPLATLELYCDRVASAVGRLAVRIFGMEEDAGLALAHHLGRALQLTNILRDVDEDAAIGRVYLPREMLAEAGMTGTGPQDIVADPRLDAAARALAGVARVYYGNAARVLGAAKTGRLGTPRLMDAVYSRLLAAMESQGWLPPRRRPRLAKWRIVLLALRYKLTG